MVVTPPALISTPLGTTPEVTPLPLRRPWRFETEDVLGTRLEALVHCSSHALARRAAQAAHAEIERLNRVLNHRCSDTEISGLQRVRRASVSADLFAVLQLSEIWRGLTRGAFDGRMGALQRLWMSEAGPEPQAVEQALAALHGSTVKLDANGRAVELSSALVLSLDAVAKGYIVDAAVEAARLAVPALEGIAVNIGGDIRCWGQSPSLCGWPIGIPAAAIPAENAPLVDAVSLSNAAIATSGLGPRDRRGGSYRSTTISPFSGYPVRAVISASVVASRAADADAMATACMVLPPEDSIAMVDRLEGAAARITAADGRLHLSRRWATVQLAAQERQRSKPAATSTAPPLPAALRWPPYWELAVSYSATEPVEQERDFKTEPLHDPYIAVWVSDAEGKPVTTLLLLGTDLRWVRENFIWWDSWNTRVKKEVYSRSRPTTRSGQYEMEWLGVDENLNPVPIGKYVLHFESSREHGKHIHRSIPLEIGRRQFQISVPDLDGVGSLEIAYKPYLTPTR